MTLISTHKLMISLCLAMAFTRVHHFGDAFSVPDASLAIFFLAGMLMAQRPAWLGLLLIEAGMLDYVAIHLLSVSDWCISPAYIFLIPTYAVMWFAGKYCAHYQTLSAKQLVITMTWAAGATGIAFIISNMSFFWLSGRFEELALLQYVQNIAQYAPAYMSAALLYILVGLGLLKSSHLWQISTVKQHS